MEAPRGSGPRLARGGRALVVGVFVEALALGGSRLGSPSQAAQIVPWLSLLSFSAALTPNFVQIYVLGFP